MIEEYTLYNLCKKYGINSKLLVSKNEKIFSYGEYIEIDKTLDYLINDLKIMPENIEKCPSILYKNINNLKKNLMFLKNADIKFINIESCLHILSCDPKKLEDTYNYVKDNYGIYALNKNTSILSVPKEVIQDVEKLNLKNIDESGILTIAVTVYFNYQTIDEIIKILESKEYREHPELFTAQVLSYATLKDIQDIIASKEYEEHSELFTSETLARSNITDVHKILQSDEFKKYPYLFTSTTLAHAKLSDIQNMIHSKEFEEHSELFTSETLARGKPENIQKMLQSDEFKKHPELFTSETLARSNIKDIQKMLQSEGFKKYPELFTSTTIARGKPENIQKMLQSKEFMEYPELFTASTLACAKIEEIQDLLALDCWKDERYKKLLTSTIVAKSNSMLKRIPILINFAEEYNFDNYLNVSYFYLSPAQNYALIRYIEEMSDSDNPFVVDGKLNPIFGKQPCILKSKYNINLVDLMNLYPYNEKNKAKKRSLER